MEIDSGRLTPGMALLKDVTGKSGKAIVKKDLELTDVHIEFIQKFLIDTVSVTPLSNGKQSKQNNISNERPITKLKDQLFADEFEEVVQQYQRLYSNWNNNVPIDMYDVRTMFVPLFEKVMKQPIQTIINLIPSQKKVDPFYYKSSAISLLAIFLADKLNYEKKDWLQIGFAAILGDAGIGKVDYSRAINVYDKQKALEMHPIHSYRMVENITTLTQQAKMAVLQHHERMDGSGYPSRAKRDKIHPYARIIAVSDFFYNHYENDTEDIIFLLEGQYGKLEDDIVNKLISLLHE